MHPIIVAAPRICAGLCAIPIGGFCAVGALMSGYSQAGYFGGAAFASLAISVWFIPAIIRTTTSGSAALGRALLLLGIAFGMVNAIGYAASHRSAGVSDAQNVIEAHTRAAAAFARLTGELEAARRHPKRSGEEHPLWIRTAGCTNATVPESTEYCAGIASIRKELAAAKATLDKPRPLSADPQADSIEALTGIAPAAFNRWWPIVIAIISEIFATGLVTLAFAPVAASMSSKSEHVPETVEPVEVIVEPEPDWLCAEPPRRTAFPRQNPQIARLTPLYLADGRSLRAQKRRVANEN